jgi:AcrR family transcriptional regulator
MTVRQYEIMVSILVSAPRASWYEGHMARKAVAASLRAARHDVYRKLIVEAAESVFAEHGKDAAKMQQIAATAGISVGVLYEVFPGKDALLEAVHEDRGQELILEAAAVADGRTPLATLEAGCDLLVRFFESHPAYLRLHLRDGITWSHPELGAGLDRSTWQAGLDMMAAALEAGRDDGTLVDDDPRASARVLMALCQVCLADWLLGQPRVPADAVIERLTELVRRTFVRHDRRTKP